MKTNVLFHRIADVLICAAAIAGVMTGCTGMRSIEQETAIDAENAAAVLPEETENAAEAVTEETTEPAAEPVYFDYTLSFAGDICYEDGGYTTSYWESCGRDTSMCFDSVMMEHMQNADVFFINNEFQFTSGGTPTYGKEFTFRSDPANVQLLKDIGTDLVSLANNHAYDYGEEGLLDTFDTLDKAGIPYVGAGRDIDEASSTYYYELDGFKIAYVSSTRVELYELTKGATETEPGVFRTVDGDQVDFLYEKVREAKENADFVVVYIHWGDEFVTYIDEFQTNTGDALIEAGADVVMGDHPHCLQGIKYHNGKPILYSLGNYWFRACSGDTMLAELHIKGTRDDFETELQLVPAVLANYQVNHIGDEYERAAFYQRMIDMSFGIDIDENGVVTDAS